MRRAQQAQQAALQQSRQVLGIVAARRDEAWRGAADHNRRRAATVLGLPLAIGAGIALLGLLLLPLAVVGLVLLLGWAGIAVFAWRAAHTGFGTLMNALTTNEAVAAGVIPFVVAERYGDVAESLCAALGLSVPELCVLVDSAPNAIATGVRPGATRIMLTTGLLSRLDRIELEAVLAHELAHVKRLDTLTGGLSVALLHGGRLAVPGARRLASFLEGRNRELEADLAAVQVTRYPPGLIAALERLTDVAHVEQRVPSSTVPASVLADTRTQWLVPFRTVGEDDLAAGTFGPIERLAVLREL
ncbi:MAG: M48 family metallopeptidase [Acidimicrobiales bacterium]